MITFAKRNNNSQLTIDITSPDVGEGKKKFQLPRVIKEATTSSAEHTLGIG